MNENKRNLLNVLFLALIIFGSLTFLIAMIYNDKMFIYLSMIQLMSGSVGYYLIESNPKNSPLI